MLTTFKLEIATPVKLMVSVDAAEATIPGQNGYLGILPHHAPLISLLKPGEMTYKHNGKVERLALSTGFVEVLGDKVSILAETAERPEDIDKERARRAKERAEGRIKSASPDIDMERAMAALARALARLQVAGGN